MHSLGVGGMERGRIRLLASLRAVGARATLVAPRGPLGDEARAAGIEVVEVDWAGSSGTCRRAVAAAADGHDATIVHWDPNTLWTLPAALAGCGRALVAIHTSPHWLEGVFGTEAHEHAIALVGSATATQAAAVAVRGAFHAARTTEALRLPPDAQAIIPLGIRAERIPFDSAPDEPGTVLAMTRLHVEKAGVVRIGADLVRARVEAGIPSRLDLVGDGPWREAAHGLCAKRLPAGAWRAEPATADPIGRLRRADIAVTGGTTTLEAAAVGRRAVVARDYPLPGGAVLTPERYEAAAEDPFGRPQVSEDFGALWSELDAVGQTELSHLRSLVEQRNSVEREASALADAIDGLREADADGLDEMARTAAQLRMSLLSPRRPPPRLPFSAEPA